MNDGPVVSIVIIFLNAEQFIEEAIESAFAQTFNQWELLLVDDGSTDGSTAIACRCAQRHPDQVRYFEHKAHMNRGMSASRNLGISNARGKYIAFLDADDVWFPYKLEQQVAILDSQPEAGMIYGLSQFWYSWSGDPEDSKRDFVHDLGVSPNTLIRPPTLLTRFFLAQDAAIPGPTDILVRHETIERVGGFEEVFRGAYEDEAFYAKVCLHEPVFAVNTCWDRYRQHPNSCMSIMEKEGKEYSIRVFFLKWLAGYLDEQGINDAELLQALQKEIWRCRHPSLSRSWKDWQHLMLGLARRLLPLPVRHWLWTKLKGIDYSPPVGWARLGNLRQVIPFSREFGYDRGLPVDRYYIDKFLSNHQTDIRGHVLEIADDAYTRRFGGEQVTKSDVLHVVPGNPKATIVGDLTQADHIPADTYDCIILTQTLQYIYDLRAALQTLYRITKPGGVVLATIPGISPVSRYDMERWGDYWRFTTLSAQRLFAEFFPAEHVHASAFGNVLTATAFLYGMAAEELKQQEKETFDPNYEVVIAVRAVKPEV